MKSLEVLKAIVLVFVTSIAFSQNIWDQNVYKKYIGTKLSEKYRIPSETASGVSANNQIYTNNGYGLASFTYPFDGSVIQREADNNRKISLAGMIDKSLIDNGFSNFRITLMSLDPVSGNPNYTTNYIFNISFDGEYNKIAGNIATFNEVHDIYQGWYTMQLHGTKGGVSSSLATIKFGVGDVFIIAGQSNARGATNRTYQWEHPAGSSIYFPLTDNVTSYYYQGTSTKPEGIRVLQATRPTFAGEQNVMGWFSYATNILQRIKLSNGLPLFRSYQRMDYKTEAFRYNQGTFEDGTLDPSKQISFDNYEQIIYPFGGASWAWMPFAKMWINSQGVPVGFYNFAINDSSIESWQQNFNNGSFENNFTVLRKFLTGHGRISGYRAILWYQGERDITDHMTFTNYKVKLETMINNMYTETGQVIPWFISQVSYSALGDYPSFSPETGEISNAQLAASVSASVANK
jgi:hypothetical protein